MMISIRQPVGIRQRMPVSQDHPGGSDAGQSMGGVAHKVGRRGGPTNYPPPSQLLNVCVDFDKNNAGITFVFYKSCTPTFVWNLNPCSKSEKDTERTSLYYSNIFFAAPANWVKSSASHLSFRASSISAQLNNTECSPSNEIYKFSLWRGVLTPFQS